MKSIDHLSASERDHFVKCSCGVFFDMRDLEAVFLHLHELRLPQPLWSVSQKKGEVKVFTRCGKTLYLN